MTGSARPGTHNHRTKLCEGWSSSESGNSTLLWIPAFAGTTPVLLDEGRTTYAGLSALRYLDLLPARRADQLDAARANQMGELDHRAVGTGLRQADAVLAADHL